KPAGLRLIEGSDCQACHNAEVKTVGPSYRAIAERYETTPATIAMLASRIREGGSGNWTELVGPAIMTPHPDLQPADAEAMVRYILALDGEEAPSEGTNGASAEEEETDDPLADMGRAYPLTEPPEDAAHGLAVNVWRFPGPLSSMPAPRPGEAPVYSGVVPALHLPDAEAYGEFDEYFYVNARGTIDIPETTNYVFRLASDDGGKLFIDGKEIIDHDGLHGPTAIDGEVFLEAGPHPIEVQYFQGGGGKALSLQWIAHGQDAFTVIQPSAFTYDAADLRETAPYEPPEPLIEGIPGDAHPLIDVHPSFRVETIRPDGFEPKVGGLGFLPDGRLVVSTWDADGSVYAVSNLDAEDRADIGVKRIAAGLLEPLGLTVVDGEIYVLQKHELTRLIDHDGDDVIDEYRTVADDWGATSNFHEFAFGLVYQDGYFYAALATAILPGGASASPQNPDRGKVVKIGKDDGSVAFVAHGLRTPNGIGLGRGGELFVADNQGDWLPSSKIVHVREGAFFGNRAVDPEGTATMEEDPPVVWLPQDEIGNSPSTPVGLDVGPYQGQLIHGEVTHGGIKRVFVEEVDGRLQGAVFRFTQGLEAGVNRIAWGPDDKLYVGGIGNPGNWGHYGKNWYGLQRMSYTGAPVFEMLAVRARSNGLEIEFTEPLPVNAGGAPADYEVRQWRYQPTAAYGGPKVDEAALPVRSVALSEDRTRVFLEVPDVEAGHVVYLRIRAPLVSQEGRALWSTEAWYTMNALPGEAGPTFAATAPYEAAAPNTLTEAERAAGWRLLFDGQTLDGWHAYGGGAPGAAWKIQDGTLTLDGTRPDTAWQYTDGGDLVTDDAFEDFELHLEWKIAEGGNSGIIYNVQEAPEYDYVWETGPEMQILDNARHPDGQIRTHRAGDLYDLIESPYVATRPVGEWNTVRLVQRDGRVEHWLNGHKIVEVDMTSDAWRALVAGSKFNEMPAFGKAVQGRIALQDHGDRVWFRNIKIRAL
ncbi:MAG: family 16 glycoside hydrolase, partial [Rhodothermales bacterium]|nr:family 16 glycoside hydrolase [Rhodothermales bacterium]